MSKTNLNIGGESIPVALNSRVIFRIFENNEKTMLEFYEEYKNNRMWGAPQQSATAQDFKMLKDYKEKKMLIRELSQKYGMSQSRVKTSLMRAVRDS